MSLSKTNSLWLVLARFCSALVFVVLRYGLHYRYQTICRNLSRAFSAKQPAEVAHLVQCYYWHLSDLCVEPFLLALAPAQLRHYLTRFAGGQLLARLYRAQKPVVLLASHYGNWEYLIQLPLYSPYPVYSAYSPPRTTWVNRLLLRLRQRFGVHLIPQSLFYRQMLTRMSRPTGPVLLALVADQRPGPASRKHQLPFLQQSTYVQLGAERLARQLDAAVVVVVCTKVARFCYDYHLELITGSAGESPPLALTRRYYQRLEAQIAASPAYWLWSHDRWKAAITPEKIAQAVDS